MVRFGEGKSIQVLLGLLVVGVATSIILQAMSLRYLVAASGPKHTARTTGHFPLLDPSLAEMPIDDFLSLQDKMTVRYAPLRNQVVEIINRERVYCTFYFEDLTTGSWIGIHEKDLFRGASLLKLQKMAAVLKKIEIAEITFDTEVEILQEDLREGSGPMAAKGANRKVTVSELLKYLVRYSDNTAAHALGRLLRPEDIFEASLAMGLRMDKSGQVSLKSYANVLRSLYMSSYLRRPFSQYALKLMAETVFTDQIPAGVPSDVLVAHKVGFWVDEKVQSDCGIVYAQDTPYIIAMMCKDVPRERSAAIMKEISAAVYGYVLAEKATTP